MTDQELAKEREEGQAVMKYDKERIRQEQEREAERMRYKAKEQAKKERQKQLRAAAKARKLEKEQKDKEWQERQEKRKAEEAMTADDPIVKKLSEQQEWMEKEMERLWAVSDEKDKVYWNARDEFSRAKSKFEEAEEEAMKARGAKELMRQLMSRNREERLEAHGAALKRMTAETAEKLNEIVEEVAS